MRILALAIFGTLSIGPATAQTYDPAYPVCLHVYKFGAITNAATRRCLSATRRHRAAPPSAWSIHIMRNTVRAKSGPTSNGNLHA